MRYAATIVALRPKRGLSDGSRGSEGGSKRTDSCGTMNENPMTLLEPRFNERDGWYDVFQDVLFLNIVDFYLFVGELHLGESLLR